MQGNRHVVRKTLDGGNCRNIVAMIAEIDLFPFSLQYLEGAGRLAFFRDKYKDFLPFLLYLFVVK